MLAEAAQAGASLVGKLFDFFANKNEARHQERVNLAYAQNGIQWKVADALKAGVHPLYALGAPTMSPSVSVGGGVSNFGDMGQDVSRAIAAGMPREGQLSAFDAAVQELTLKKFGLENELLASQIAKMKQDILSKPAVPSMTLPGGGKFVPGQSSTAQVWQDQYGDIVENVAGLTRLQWDALENYVPPSWLEKSRRAWRTPASGPGDYNRRIGSGGRR